MKLYPWRLPRWVKWILGTVLVVFLVILAGLFALQTSIGQQWLKGRVDHYVENKLGSKIIIGQLKLQGFRQITLNNLTIFDQQDQPILHSDSLMVRLHLLELLRNRLVIRELSWKNVLLNVYSDASKKLNYQFILDSLGKDAASVDTAEKDPTATPLQFRIGQLNLQNLTVRYEDGAAGLASAMKINALLVTTDHIDPYQGIYEFRQIRIDGLQGFYSRESVEQKNPIDPVDSATSAIRLNARALLINQSTFEYSDNTNGIKTGWNLPRATFRLFSLHLDRQVLNSGYTELIKPSGYVHRNASKDSVSNSGNASWLVTSPSLKIKDGRFRFMDVQSRHSPFKNAFDPTHFYLSPLHVTLKNFSYTDTLINAGIADLQFTEKSGFMIKNASGKFTYTDSRIRWEDMHLETRESLIKRSVELSVPSWSKKEYSPANFRILADLASAQLQLSELLYFVPEMEHDPSLKKIWNKSIHVTGKISGFLNNLDIRDFKFSDNWGNKIEADGKIRNVHESTRIFASLDRVTISTGNKGLRGWIPEKSIPHTMSLPDKIFVKGRFRGGLQDADANLNINTSSGKAILKGIIKDYTNPSSSRYDVDVVYMDMDLGKILQDTSIGNLRGRGSIRGSGYVPESMNANGRFHVEQFSYQGNRYENIDVKGRMSNGNYSAAIDSKDSDLAGSFLLSGKVGKGMPTINGEVKIDRIDLQALGFTTAPFIVKGEIEVNIENTAPRQLSGAIMGLRLQFSDGKQVYALDSILLRANADNGIQNIHFESPFGYASVSGEFDYTKVSSIISSLVLHHIDPGKATPIQSAGSQKLEFNASLSWPDNLSAMLPQLKMKRPVLVDGRLNSDSSLFILNLSQPSFRYADMTIDSTQLNYHSDKDSMNAIVSIAGLQHPSLPMKKSIFRSKSIHGNMNWDMDLFNVSEELKYDISGGILFHDLKNMDIRFSPDLLLNQTSFTTGTPNGVLIREGKIQEAQLQLLADSQKIKLQTLKTTKGVPPVMLELENFKLTTISGLLETDTALIAGLVNGKIFAESTTDSLALTGDIKIDSLQVKNAPLGQLLVSIQTNARNRHFVNASLSGNNNDVKLIANYSDQLDADITINSLNLASAEVFTMGEMRNMHGLAKGNLKVTGKIAAPQVNGSLNFPEARGTIRFLNTQVKLKNQEIMFNQIGIGFQEFKMTDSLGGEILINGYVLTDNYTDFEFDLSVDANEFMVLGPKYGEDQLFYGPAFIDSRMRVRGGLELPEIDMNVRLRDESEVTFVIPEEEPGIANREGVIVFVDKDNPIDSTLLQRVDNISATTRFSGISYSGDIEITPASVLRLVVDKYNGDFLEARGNGNLNLTIDPSNKITLTGRYEIDSGKYEMSLNQLIKRSFYIEKGSSISWNGDLLRGMLDISAKHTVNPPAIDLVRDQITSTTLNQIQYKQRIPVEIYLSIKDELLKPAIGFRLDMPEKDRNIFNGSVYTRLKQINNIPSELNKQVMGLLVLQSFISDNPLAVFNDRNEGGIAFAAKQSVSKILSQQINNLADNLIKGVDLNFDIQTREDYYTGERRESTSLSVAARKNLFNERLSVSVGSSIGLFGNNPEAANSLIGDLSIDYAISRDGRYKLRAYRKNQTDVILEGQIIESGLSFMLVVDYEKFSEIFKRSRKEQSRRKRK